MASKSQVSNYYSAAQTKQILGITDGQLYNYINNGTLERVIPPGKKQGVYRKSEVDQLTKEWNAFLIQRKKNPTFLERVTTEEQMQECMEISQALFGVGRETVKARMEILRKNPNTYFMLRDETQIIGYSAVMTLKVGKLEQILAQMIPVKINPNDIEDFSKNKEADLYLHAIGIKPGFSTTEKHVYGSKLVGGIIDLIQNMGSQGIKISTIAARSNMPDGIRLMKHAGFTEIEPLTPERRTFIINVEESGIPFIRQYKEALKEATKK